MKKELASGEVAKNAKYELNFEEGYLVAKIDYDGKVMDAGMYVKLSVDEVIDAIKKAIPGKIDDLILDNLKLLLKS